MEKLKLIKCTNNIFCFNNLTYKTFKKNLPTSRRHKIINPPLIMIKNITNNKQKNIRRLPAKTALYEWLKIAIYTVSDKL